MTTFLSYVLLSVLVSVVSFVCCVSCFVCRRCGCGDCCLFCGIAVFVPLPFCLYPVFCPLTWGRCLGCGCGFAWFAGGFSGVVLLPCGCVYPVLCALLLGCVCLGWGWCVCGRVGVLCCAVVPFLVCMVCRLYVVCCFWYVCVLLLVCRRCRVYDVYCF